jgi:hypothetical protein
MEKVTDEQYNCKVPINTDLNAYSARRVLDEWHRHETML